MDKFCDLHTHSCYSDGTDEPARLIAIAEETGLSAVALCDHNTVDGLPAFLEAGRESSVEAVPGIEFSTVYGKKELHILGLFIKAEHYAAINTLLLDATLRKEQSNLALVERLRERGIILDYGQIKREATGVINRSVLAAHMVKKGYCASVQEAFDRWLDHKAGLYEPPQRLSAYEVIRFIKSIGAVAVLAHPFLSLDEAQLREFLSHAEGLDGMEVYYSEYTPEQTALAHKIAEEFGLVKSGGSDYHGSSKPHIRMGAGKGNLRIPMECLRELKTRI